MIWPLFVFVDRKTGYAAGDSVILKTTDGGATWKRLTAPRSTVRALAFRSPADGWAIGDTLLHTSDGGASWQPAASLPGASGIGPVAVVGAAVVVLHAPGAFRSDDGGRTWKTLGNTPANDYSAIFFLNDRQGWLAGDHGRIASTTDGGRTWKAEELPGGARFTKVQFLSPQIGWLLPRNGHGPVATTDGGKSWKSQYAGVAPGRTILDMSFLDAKNGYLLNAVDHGTTVLYTDSGGANWRLLGTLKPNCAALSFPVEDEGWVVGAKGYIAHFHPVR